MSLNELALSRLSPARLWTEMDRDSRLLAATAVYDPDGDGKLRQEADMAIAKALRFREARVKQLPVKQRVEYLAKAVRPDDGQAYSFLLALHLVHRRGLLEAFLDELGVPQENGLIAEDHDLERPDAERLDAAVARVRREFPAEQVELYLMSLLAMDAEVWEGLGRHVGPGATGR